MAIFYLIETWIQFSLTNLHCFHVLKLFLLVLCVINILKEDV
jgi:hypothetical protein